MERMAGKTAHSWALIGGLSAWAALQPVVGCNGTTTQDTGNPVDDSPIVVQLLGSVGPDIVVPTLERFAVEASALSASLEALEAANQAGEDTAGLRAEAQTQWVETMRVWAELDVMQIGPQGSSLSAISGEDIRDEVYSWPTTVNPCRVDQVTADESYSEDSFFSSNLVNAYGLDALEHLLFADQDTPCPSQVPPVSDGAWDALGESGIALNRSSYALALSNHIEDQAADLIETWSADGGNFSGHLARTTDDTPYGSDQEALNAVFDALFFLEKTTKDVKLAKPLGKLDCEDDICPEDVEGVLSGSALVSIESNILGFSALFHGGDGVGLDDLLVDVGHGDLAEQISSDLDEALESLAGIEGSLEQAIVDDYAQVETFYEELRDVTSALKGDLATVLALQIPSEAAGDND